MKVEVGNEVAFNKLPDAVWFVVEDIALRHTLVVRESGTDYAAQCIDISAVKQVRKAQ